MIKNYNKINYKKLIKINQNNSSCKKKTYNYR